MTPRPYIKSSIDELEKLYEQSKGDPQVLLTLLEELENRSTSRPRKLRAEAEKQLARSSVARVSNVGQIIYELGKKPGPGGLRFE